MVTLLSIVLWTSFATIFYSYVGYPLLVHAAASFVGKRFQGLHESSSHSANCEESDLPSVTVLIAAHNAGDQIAGRLENLLACDYPTEKLQIVVAADGCTDNTVQLVRDFNLPNVRVVPFAFRRGKASTLVDAMGHVSSEVVLFTDASTRFATSAVRRIATHFHDLQTGIVSGKVTMLDEQGQPTESLYWRSEMMVRRSESRLGLLTGSSGAIYAMRRALFVSPTGPIINDDLVFPMLAYMKHRCRFILDESAEAFATSYGGLKTEFRRRSRIGAGGFQSLSVLRDIFRLKNAWQAIGFVSHKLLRWVGPFLLILMLLCNLGLLMMPGYQGLLWLQAVAYLLAVGGLFAPDHGRVAPLARSATSFLIMNAALLAGFFQWLADANQVVWNPTPRRASSSQV